MILLNRPILVKRMKAHKSILALISMMALTICSCSYEFPDIPEESLGELSNADLTSPVFMGSTAFSGLADGVLTSESVKFSIPELILASRVRTGEESNLNSPTVAATTGYNLYESNSNQNIGPYFLSYSNPDSTTFIRRIEAQGEAFAYENTGGSIKNFSFPRTQILDYTESGRNVNSFTTSFFNGNSSVAATAANSNPTFFVLNLGLEDLLGFALNGGEGNANQTSIGAHRYADMLSPALFETKLNEAVNAFLSANPNAKGALLNIPDFLKFPHFSKVRFDITPYVINSNIPRDMRTQANLYNNRLISYYQNNPGVPANERRPFLDFANDIQFNWGTLVLDNTLGDVDFNGQPLPKARHARSSEIIFYSKETLLFDKRGQFTTNALGEGDYLKLSEITAIRERRAAYNQIIASVVSASNGRLSLIDIDAYFNILFQGFNPLLGNLGEGTVINGATFLPIVGQFGIFSADGLNLNSRGNALIANQLIQKFNQDFGGNLKGINANAFAGTAIQFNGSN
jgi:hypothetical protein